MNCPTCGREVEANSGFCGSCGTNLSEVAANDGFQQPMVGFGESIGLGFTNYLVFSGRATRAEFWWWMLFGTLVQIIPFIGSIIGLVCLIPSLAVTSRRLHDIGKTGWWQLWMLLVGIVVWGIFIGALIFGVILSWGEEDGAGLLTGFSIAGFIGVISVIVWYVVWLARQGDKGPNTFGPDPRTTPR